jgi:hypothetical protein
MTCRNVASVQTQPTRGPAGTSAVLKVSSEDDHGKNTHLCEADYQLLITRASESEPVVQTLLSSDDAWDRKISIRLDGFSHDGKIIFGVLSESGINAPSETLFEYDTTDSKVRLFDLQKQIRTIVRPNCPATADVSGTARDGAPVIELSFANDCAPRSRWLLDSRSGRLQQLDKATAVIDLFSSTSAVP